VKFTRGLLKAAILDSADSCLGNCPIPDDVETTTIESLDGNQRFVYWEIDFIFLATGECFRESMNDDLPYPLSSPLYYWSKYTFDNNYYEARQFYFFFTVATFLLLDIVFPICIILNVVFKVDIKFIKGKGDSELNEINKRMERCVLLDKLVTVPCKAILILWGLERREAMRGIFFLALPLPIEMENLPLYLQISEKL